MNKVYAKKSVNKTTSIAMNFKVAEMQRLMARAKAAASVIRAFGLSMSPNLYVDIHVLDQCETVRAINESYILQLCEPCLDTVDKHDMVHHLPDADVDRISDAVITLYNFWTGLDA